MTINSTSPAFGATLKIGKLENLPKKVKTNLLKAVHSNNLRAELKKRNPNWEVIIDTETYSGGYCPSTTNIIASAKNILTGRTKELASKDSDPVFFTMLRQSKFMQGKFAQSILTNFDKIIKKS